jgi:hypothetical protein
MRGAFFIAYLVDDPNITMRSSVTRLVGVLRELRRRTVSIVPQMGAVAPPMSLEIS